MTQQKDLDTVLPLSGMRVLEFSNGKTDMVGRLLADLGAEVLLLETPQGVQIRSLPPSTRDRASILLRITQISVVWCWIWSGQLTENVS